MSRQPDATDAMPPDPTQLLALLRDGDVDAALDAGLMHFDAGMQASALDPQGRALILVTQQRLRSAWEARERYRLRQARLARIAEERAAKRAIPAQAAADTNRPVLPSAAASALARARAKASAGRTS